MADSFDIKKDYYEILGHDNSATIEELKSSHVKLALQYHPDTSNTLDSKIKQANEDKFREVSEAWSVLSKPEIKQRYDREREVVYKIKAPIGTEYNYIIDKNGSNLVDNHLKSTISRFETAQKNSPIHWKENMSKYRTNDWKKLHINDKKVSRKIPFKSFWPSIIPLAVTFTFASYFIYKYG